MILDSGILTVFRKEDRADQGRRPDPVYTMIHQGWYGVLNFETSPARQPEGRKELKTDLRVRILQSPVRQHDVVVLDQVDSLDKDADAFSITRAYHGRDQDNGALISDLSLEVYQP